MHKNQHQTPYPPSAACGHCKHSFVARIDTHRELEPGRGIYQTAESRSARFGTFAGHTWATMPRDSNTDRGALVSSSLCAHHGPLATKPGQCWVAVWRTWIMTSVNNIPRHERVTQESLQTGRCARCARERARRDGMTENQEETSRLAA